MKIQCGTDFEWITCEDEDNIICVYDPENNRFRDSVNILRQHYATKTGRALLVKYSWQKTGVNQELALGGVGISLDQWEKLLKKVNDLKKVDYFKNLKFISLTECCKCKDYFVGAYYKINPLGGEPRFEDPFDFKWFPYKKYMWGVVLCYFCY